MAYNTKIDLYILQIYVDRQHKVDISVTKQSYTLNNELLTLKV